MIARRTALRALLHALRRHYVVRLGVRYRSDGQRAELLACMTCRSIFE